MISSEIVVLVVMVKLLVLFAISTKARCIFYMCKQGFTGFVAMSCVGSGGGIGGYFCGKYQAAMCILFVETTDNWLCSKVLC